MRLPAPRPPPRCWWGVARQRKLDQRRCWGCGRWIVRGLVMCDDCIDKGR